MTEHLPTIRREKVRYGGLRDEQVQTILEYAREETPDTVKFETIATRQCDPSMKQFLIIDVEVREKFTLSFKAGIVGTEPESEPDDHFLKKGNQKYDGPYTLRGLLDEITSLSETVHV